MSLDCQCKHCKGLEQGRDCINAEHTKYWVEVCSKKFEEDFDRMFSFYPTKGTRLGFVRPDNLPYPPNVRFGDNCIVFHQETAIYADFKIDWNGGKPRYYLHNYSFWA